MVLSSASVTHRSFERDTAISRYVYWWTVIRDAHIYADLDALRKHRTRYCTSRLRTPRIHPMWFGFCGTRPCAKFLPVIIIVQRLEGFCHRLSVDAPAINSVFISFVHSAGRYWFLLQRKKGRWLRDSIKRSVSNEVATLVTAPMNWAVRVKWGDFIKGAVSRLRAGLPPTWSYFRSTTPPLLGPMSLRQNYWCRTFQYWGNLTR